MPETSIFNYLTNFADKTLTVQDTAFPVAHDKILRYPASLGGGGSIPFTVFLPYKKPTGLAALNSIQNENALFENLPPPEFAIVLPTPSSALKTLYSAQYATIELGQPAGAGLQLLGAGQSETPQPATPVLDVLKATGIGIGAGVASAIGSSPEAANLIAGQADNPYTENIFKNVDFRTHDFSYTFMPKNLTESQTIDRIISLFKYGMLPKPGVTGFFEFPYEFQITHSVQSTTFTLLPSVLESFDVDFSGGADTPKLFKAQGSGYNHYPTKIVISMKFKEMVLLNRNRVIADNFFATDTAGVPSGVRRYRF